MGTEGSSEGVHPESIFPIELWTKIFSKLRGAKDVTSAYYASDFFKPALELRVAVEVILITKKYLDEEADEEYQLTYLELLNCRLLNRNWRKVIDQCLEIWCRPRYHMHVIPYLILTKTEIRSAIEMLEYFAYKRLPLSPRLPGRRLLIQIDSDDKDCRPRAEELSRFLKVLRDFLKQLGKQIWYLSLNVRAHSALVKFYEFFYNLLPELPNVRGMYLKFEDAAQAIAQQEGDVPITDFNPKDLADFISKHPFPKLPLLTDLHLACVPNCIRNTVILANSQVKTFFIELVRGCPFKQSHALLPQMDYFWLYDCPESLIEDWNLISPQNWPQVKRICVERVMYREESLSMSSGLFPTLETFDSTLRHLELFSIHEPLKPSWRLNLPNLEILHLSPLEAICLDFMLPMTNLKDFGLVLDQNLIDSSAQFDEETQLPFRNYTASFEKSNMWEKFQRLAFVLIAKAIREEGEETKTRLFKHSRDLRSNTIHSKTIDKKGEWFPFFPF